MPRGHLRLLQRFSGRAAFRVSFQEFYPDTVQCPDYRSFVVTASAFNTSSLFSLAAINLDRYATLFFHLNYKQIVTTRRACAVLAFIWTIGLLLAALSSLWDPKLWHAGATSVISVALLVISISFIKICYRLRAQQIQRQAPDQAQHLTGNTLNMERYRRTASAMLMVYMLFLICY